MRATHITLACLLLSSIGLHAGSPTPAVLTPRNGCVVSSGWRITWSATGAFAERLSDAARLPLYTSGLHEWPASEGAFNQPGYERTDGLMLSVVGSIVSFKVAYEGSGGVHPTYGASIRAVDLDDKGQVADILQLFEEPSFVRALRAVPQIAERLGAEQPSTLDDLLRLLGSPCEIDFQSLRHSFAVVAVKGRTATVKIGLGHGCEVMRGQFTEFDVSAPFRRALHREFAAAGKRQSLLYSLTPE